MKLLVLALFFFTSLVSCAYQGAYTPAPVVLARGLTGSDDDFNRSLMIFRGLTGSDDDLGPSYLLIESNSADGLDLGSNCVFNAQCASNVCNGGNCDICIANEHCDAGMICNDDGDCVEHQSKNPIPEDESVTDGVKSPSILVFSDKKKNEEEQEAAKDDKSGVEHHTGSLIICGIIGVATIVGGVTYRKLSHSTIIGGLNDSLA